MKLVKKIGHAPRPRRLFAIDPGNVLSAYCLYDSKTRKILAKGKLPNELFLATMLNLRPERVVCEKIASYGMCVGETVFDTCAFTGRIYQLCRLENIPCTFLKRHEVKKAFTPLPRRNDSEIRASLIRLYGEQGTKKTPGPTYGFSGDMWAALAVAHAFSVYDRTSI